MAACGSRLALADRGDAPVPDALRVAHAAQPRSRRGFEGRSNLREHPKPWDDPDGALHQKQFLQTLESCLAALPRRTAEICRQLGLTANHCWVLREQFKLLRRSLQQLFEEKR